MIRCTRETDVAQGARLHLETWRSAYRGLMPARFLDGLTIERFEATWREKLASSDGELQLVAEDQGRLVGFLGAGPSHPGFGGFDHELRALYVHPSSQGSGFGRQLVDAYVGWLIARGCDAFFLWVLRENTKARRAYSALGGVALGHERLNQSFEGSTLIEVAYGWTGLRENKSK